MSKMEAWKKMVGSRRRREEAVQKEGSRARRVLGLGLASVHNLVICSLFLVSFCFAWFTSEVTSDGPVLSGKTASYGVWAEVSGNGTVSRGDASTVQWQLSSGQRYDVRLEATGVDAGSVADHGFCVVSVGDKLYRTVPFGACGDVNCMVCGGKREISFHVEVSGNEAKMELVPYWGQYRYQGGLEAGGDLLEDKGQLVVSSGDSGKE